MAKAKSKAIVSVADGRGGLTRVIDHRFDRGDWPISFTIPRERGQADNWFHYIAAACAVRGWSSSLYAQQERAENSGTITLTSQRDGAQLAIIIWERKRDRHLNVWARSLSGSTQNEVEEFLVQVNDSSRRGLTTRKYSRGMLTYFGLPWRGELWLDDGVRVGPPSRQQETSLLGPRIILVDLLLDCIGDMHHAYIHTEALRELSLFLSVAMREYVRRPESGANWTWDPKTGECEVRQIGYLEKQISTEMPPAGVFPGVALLAAGDTQVIGRDTEYAIHSDVVALWKRLRALSPERREQFFRAATKWQEAMMLWQDRSTLSFALMVVACEALKPPGKKFEENNVYDVIEVLLGKPLCDQLRQHLIAPQGVRNAHLHSGAFLGSELVRSTMFSSYRDPTFDQAHRFFAAVTPNAIFQWLRCGGLSDMRARSRRARGRAGDSQSPVSDV